MCHCLATESGDWSSFLRLALAGGRYRTDVSSQCEAAITTALSRTRTNPDGTKPTQLDQSDEYEWASIGGDGGI